MEAEELIDSLLGRKFRFMPNGQARDWCPFAFLHGQIMSVRELANGTLRVQFGDPNFFLGFAIESLNRADMYHDAGEGPERVEGKVLLY